MSRYNQSPSSQEPPQAKLAETETGSQGSMVVDSSKNDILWISMIVAWWFGGAVAWLGVLGQSELMEPTLDFPQQSMRSSLLMGTGLFIVAISLVLRLPAVTQPIGSSSSKRMLVWLLGAAATVNWLGMLSLRSETVWPLLLLLVLALAAESWLILTAMMIGAFRVETIWSARAQQDHPPFQQALPEVSTSSSRASRVAHTAFADSDRESAESHWIRSTTTDQLIEGGLRQLAGEIHVVWEGGQRIQNLVVGFIPAFAAVPHLEYEAGFPEEAVRCLNCTQTGMRLEIKRSGQLDAGRSTLAWAATEDEQLVNRTPISPSAQSTNKDTRLIQGLP